MERTIVQMLSLAAEKYGTRAYTTKKIDGNWIACSFAQTQIITDNIAACLLKKGMKPEDKVSILSEGSSQWVNIELAVLKARGISVPLSIKLTESEIAFRVNHSESTMIAVSHNTIEKVAKAFNDFDHKVVLVYLGNDDDRIKEVSTKMKWKKNQDFVIYDELNNEGKLILENNPDIVENSVKEINENDVINICYTSGTTGNPKGIMLTHLNYWANSHDAVKLFELPDATFETLIVLPVDHSFAHTVGIYTAFLRGITLHFVDSGKTNASIIRNFPKNLKEVNPIFMMTVPSISGSFMKKMRQEIHKKGGIVEKIFNNGLQAGITRNGDGFNKPKGFIRVKTFFPYFLANILIFKKLRAVFGSRIKYCVGGGALLEAKQQHFFAAIGAPIFQGYGLTEAAPIISSNSPKSYKFGTSGRVAPSIECKIVKDDGTQAKVNEKGEIVIKGDNVMKGYFKNEKASEEVLRDGWLFTGDLGYFDEDGFLVVTGRAKALLISKEGEKYSPEEVEEVMYNNVDIINQLLVYNDHRPSTTALVTLQEENVKALIKANSITDAKGAYDLIIKTIKSYEAKAESVPTMWHPARFAIIEKPFSEDDGLVNSTMKLVRYKTVEFYRERLELLYSDPDENRNKNLEIIKKLFF
ncbi:MAG: AMP-binding protein [Sphaerochaetaceae bacterium]|nr:AMP-binding protein [Sphaerochaetaceae bacterium]